MLLSKRQDHCPIGHLLSLYELIVTLLYCLTTITTSDKMLYRASATFLLLS